MSSTPPAVLYIPSLPPQIKERDLRKWFHAHTTIKVFARPNGRYAQLLLPTRALAEKHLDESPLCLRILNSPTEECISLYFSTSPVCIVSSPSEISYLCDPPLRMVPEHRDYLEAENEHLRFLHGRAQDDIAATSSHLEDSLAEIERFRCELIASEDRLRVVEGERDDALHALEDAKTRLLSQTSELEYLRNEKVWRDAAHRREKELRERDVEKWGAKSSAWTPDIAVDRALFMLEEFSTSTFSPSSPLTFSALPWPILGDIQRLDPSDMTWSAVDDFFRHVKMFRASEYKQMGEQMRKNFHPDRWRARNILKTVVDEELRVQLEEAGNRVAQAVNRSLEES